MAYQPGRIAAETHGEQANHDELAHDRIAECCAALGCRPHELVAAVKRLAARKDPDVLAIAWAVYNSDDAVSVAGISRVIAAEIG